MPVRVRKMNKRWRLIESSGTLAVTRSGAARDGGGHTIKKTAERQAKAINSRKVTK
jgi:hypothetical protein